MIKFEPMSTTYENILWNFSVLYIVIWNVKKKKKGIFVKLLYNFFRNLWDAIKYYVLIFLVENILFINDFVKSINFDFIVN